MQGGAQSVSLSAAVTTIRNVSASFEEPYTVVPTADGSTLYILELGFGGYSPQAGYSFVEAVSRLSLTPGSSPTVILQYNTTYEGFANFTYLASMSLSSDETTLYLVFAGFNTNDTQTGIESFLIPAAGAGGPSVLGDPQLVGLLGQSFQVQRAGRRGVRAAVCASAAAQHALPLPLCRPLPACAA